MMTQTVPLEMTVDGVLRVGNTRVTLDTIVGAFNDGASAEEIAERYPVVPLADVYYVIGYYLSHYDEVESYLKERLEISQRVREENEKRFNSVGLRARLLARQRQQKL